MVIFEIIIYIICIGAGVPLVKKVDSLKLKRELQRKWYSQLWTRFAVAFIYMMILVPLFSSGGLKGDMFRVACNVTIGLVAPTLTILTFYLLDHYDK